jgi:subfamily B ATP-binding cassette protein MsbA
MMETLGGVAVAIVILYGGAQVIDGSRTPGAFSRSSPRCCFISR